MKTKKVMFAALTVIMFVVGISVLQSCSNNDELAIENKPNSPDSNYLCIYNITNRNSFSTNEKAIFNEAQKRIVNHLKKNDKGFWSLEHTTASELNMDESLFNIFTELYKSGQVLNSTKNMKTNKRMKTPGEYEMDPLSPCTQAYLLISTQLNSIEQKFFDNYWTSGGNMNLTQSDMQSIVNTTGRSVNSSTTVTIGGQQYTAKQVNYYGSEYKYAFGTATEYYNAKGECVGFKDSYDFNAAARSWKNETITRAVGSVGELCGATNYNITYGIHQ